MSGRHNYAGGAGNMELLSLGAGMKYFKCINCGTEVPLSMRKMKEALLIKVGREDLIYKTPAWQGALNREEMQAIYEYVMDLQEGEDTT